MSKTYTLAVTKTIVVDASAESEEHAQHTVNDALRANAYSWEWDKAVNKLDLIAVG